MKRLYNYSSIGEYLAVAASEEGYRSARELLCNYCYNFGYTPNDFRLHMVYKYGVYYSSASYRQAFYRYIGTNKRRVIVKRKRGGSSFDYRKVEQRYEAVTRYCLGYRTFREALYFLLHREGLNYRQVAGLYGVSKGALQYRVKRLRRIKSKSVF